MTAAEATQTLLKDEWEPSVPGRADVPTVVENAEDGPGVLISRSNNQVRTRLNVHDHIEVEFVGRTVEDTGSQSERVTDTVQITIRISDRDTDGDELREGTEARMFGTRDANNDGPTLGGLAGEVKRILNGIRKGFEEWDYSTHTIDEMWLRNTDARAVFTLELIIVERDVQQPI